MTSLRVTRERTEQIAEFAEFVAEEYCPTGRVEPTTILKANGITHSAGYYGDHFDGLLEHKNGRFHVYANLDRLEVATGPRARFTLAHELGHYYIDEHRNALRAGAPPHGSKCDFESQLLVEREADTFASHLLLPTARFRDLAKSADRGIAGIVALSREFGTSLTSTAIRYARDEIIPCTVIKWKHDGFGWKWFSPSTYEARFRAVITDRSKLPADSATELIFAGEPAGPAGFMQRGSTAALWFPFLTDSSHRNCIVIEEAISLGRFGVLTLLYPDSGDYASSW